MTNEIDKFKSKIRNTQKLKRDKLQFNIKEALLLEQEIAALQKRIDKLEVEALQRKTLTVDIVGRNF